MRRSVGVGFLGAGLVTQAIHLPALAGMPDQFHVVRVMDIDARLAERVADRCGASFSTDADSVFDDPDVEVVVVASPNALHASQVVAACAAGKRAVLCEKPLAESHGEADAISAAAHASGTHIMVGAMHAYDAGFAAAHRAWLEEGEEALFTQSSILLPHNDVFTDQAAEPASPTPPTPSNAGVSDAVMVRGGMLGLAIHNFPLIRMLNPVVGRVVSAEFVRPWGYMVVLTDGLHTLELLAYMGGAWASDWSLRAVSRTCDLRATFPPSFVTGGSSVVHLTTGDSSRTFQFDINGYQREWEVMYDVVVDGANPPASVDDVVADVVYALDIADQVDRVMAARS